MSVTSSKKVIYAALIGNALIAAIKFIASVVTGSSAMLSEVIHGGYRQLGFVVVWHKTGG